ncbi:helix-turn-helix domain-containing protein [Novosphingobium aquae]|uniref:Helix-turn-helix domain-containing protein n=1 Tax=Novosphingobium aquae TaxID=3133435 RepID=A0ABU8SB28_9SPHN
MTAKSATHEPLAAAFDPEGGIFAMTSEIVNLIAIRLEEALASGLDQPLDSFSDQVRKSLRRGYAKAPVAVIEAIRNLDANSPIRMSYVLGQLGMAQTVSSRARDRRVGEDFAAVLKSEAMALYVDALACGDKTNSELSDEVGERVETVSRKLKKLRDIGAADFRRDGVHVYNFLTPAAKALARATRNKGALPEPRKALSVVVSQKLGNLDSFWNNIPDFSNDDALQSAQA